MAKGKKTGGRVKGSKNKKPNKSTLAETVGKAVLLASDVIPAELELPIPFALRMLNTPIPDDAPLIAKIAALDFKGKMAALAAPYCHARKGEEREPPKEPPAPTGDDTEITYDAARRVLFALAILEREGT